METELLSSSILQSRDIGKYQRDDIYIFSHQRKNRRFRKFKQRRHNNGRKNIYRENERKIVEETKTKNPENRMLLTHIISISRKN